MILMKNHIQWNVFASGMLENAIFVIYELGIKYWTIFIKTNYLKWLNIEISVRLTKLKAIWIILIFEKTISTHRSTKVEEYSIKTRGRSLNSNASTISSNSIWIFSSGFGSRFIFIFYSTWSLSLAIYSSIYIFKRLDSTGTSWLSVFLDDDNKWFLLHLRRQRFFLRHNHNW